VGVIGVMQALEVIKIIVHDSSPSSGHSENPVYRASMTTFAAFESPQWRTFRLRAKKPGCIACGDKPTTTAESIQQSDYSALCARVAAPEITERVSVQVSNIRFN
jgi:adenylyltransferase/sulfurtransferase